eukprot:CAMPEP_0182464626 /NCGR_PEP_ID=MMETSP1319-20130603/8751_1 /TAXON_ID=172717 /ORGANISM="Bolidomonas pacifica, Strain RCC208" /LENGTH=52 /DNA_ID=CAMNT_0024664283 /DNA_START=52 /DNA_END=207 /DNA_ORIENTATION=-
MSGGFGGKPGAVPVQYVNASVAVPVQGQVVGVVAPPPAYGSPPPPYGSAPPP